MLTNGKCRLRRTDPNKLEEVIFSRETLIQSHPVLTFDNSPAMKTTHHEHLGLILNEKLNFKEH